MKKRWKIVAAVVPVVVIVLIVAVFVLRSNQQAGIRMIKSDINLEAGEDAYQSCWAVGSHNFARAENGYYFMADNGKSLMYFDASTKDVIPVCAKPDCKHDDYDCNSYLGKGEYQLFSVYYYNGYVYVLKNNMGNAQLVQISEDGATRKGICDVLPTEDAGSLDVVFHDNKAYIYDHCGNFVDADANKESEVTIKEVDINNGSVRTVYSVTAMNAGFFNARSYGDKLLFLMQMSRDKLGQGDSTIEKLMETQGLYAYDYASGETELIMEGNICDYSIDETNKIIYYFESGKGLYKQSLNNGSKGELIYKAEKDCMKCNMSYDGRYIYLDNTDWAASSTGGKGMSCRVIDTDGNLVNRIDNPWNGYGDIYFGDDRYMFSNFFDYGEDGSGAGTMFWYIPKDEVSTATEWTRLTDKSIHLIDELELRKRSK